MLFFEKRDLHASDQFHGRIADAAARCETGERDALGSSREGVGTAAKRGARKQAGRGEETARRCSDQLAGAPSRGRCGCATELFARQGPATGKGACNDHMLSIAGTHDVRARARRWRMAALPLSLLLNFRVYCLVRRRSDQRVRWGPLVMRGVVACWRVTVRGRSNSNSNSDQFHHPSPPSDSDTSKGWTARSICQMSQLPHDMSHDSTFVRL